MKRSSKPPDMKGCPSYEMHVYADASEKSYGMVAYIRIDDGIKIHCCLLMAKARVAPLK